jgi:hypothetical protein
LAREKQLREAAEREKAVLEQKLIEYQEEIRLAKEALVSNYQTYSFHFHSIYNSACVLSYVIPVDILLKMKNER